jgi:hypothetical protein
MDQEKAQKFLSKYLSDNNKMTVFTELDTWYGETPDGTKSAITEISMLEVIELGFRDPVLLEKAQTEDFIVLPDGAKFGKTIKALRENGLTELAMELTSMAKQMNVANGFEDPDPEKENDPADYMQIDKFMCAYEEWLKENKE